MFWKHRLTHVGKLLRFDRRWGGRRRLGLAQQVCARHHRRQCRRHRHCCGLGGHCCGCRIQCCCRNYLGHHGRCRHSEARTRGYGLGLRRMPRRNHLWRNSDCSGDCSGGPGPSRCHRPGALGSHSHPGLGHCGSERLLARRRFRPWRSRFGRSRSLGCHGVCYASCSHCTLRLGHGCCDIRSCWKRISGHHVDSTHGVHSWHAQAIRGIERRHVVGEAVGRNGGGCGV